MQHKNGQKMHILKEYDKMTDYVSDRYVGQRIFIIWTHRYNLTIWYRTRKTSKCNFQYLNVIINIIVTYFQGLDDFICITSKSLAYNPFPSGRF